MIYLQEGDPVYISTPESSPEESDRSSSRYCSGHQGETLYLQNINFSGTQKNILVG